LVFTIPFSVSVFPGPSDVIDAAADMVIFAIADAVATRDRALVVLAGGTTPRALYARLAASRDAIPWDKVWWCFGDERWAPRRDRSSNFAMVEHVLFSRAAIPREHIFAVPTDEADPAAGARAYEKSLREQFPGEAWPHVDLALMGLGADGHTASLFPGDAALSERTAWVTTTRAGRDVPDRVTLTVPVFAHARFMIYLVSGATKAAAVAATLGGNRDPDRWPAQAVMPRSGRCVWLLDRAAARSLPPAVRLSS
jgi:6-phosphogluconolactonase